jgi:hypothetical protein
VPQAKFSPFTAAANLMLKSVGIAEETGVESSSLQPCNAAKQHTERTKRRMVTFPLKLRG